MNEGLVVVIRGIIGFFTLLIFARLLGKQLISELTLFDYIIGITIGSTASSLTTDLTSRAWPHWVGITIWVLLAVIFQFITLKSKPASDYIDDKPTIIMLDGQILESAMGKRRYRIEDLLAQLRSKNIFNLNEVKFALLEKDGTLSVLKKSEYNNVTLKDLNIPTSPANPSFEIIYDGVIIEKNLQNANTDVEWLKGQLKLRNLKVSDVFLASLCPPDNLYIDLYKDHIKS
ncbi:MULTISPECIES: DUF421 domain-containing protein [Clostridium]|uniref:Uncharacterized membrane protein n=1 Tax=Clostridium novyi (strain NT) TaxID=386415 RepID=A0Q3A8_CLONN|nr:MULTISPECIES: DUF421 domain-containing protein [Clostridium]ABK62569.1 uncharacterized membrane protein [Clostridium novyi NT]KEH86562.1 hypothetical protein Z967_05645 [Clostridium novyi A str. 4540]KEH87372.1 hypothetical protein Z965_06335 [Clostridium novyi A str. BKT29909]KEH87566.1 hypothetical protein Z966_10990 [Clostridium novyi A str. NCTC 538]KEH90908.1 hypothetical protein Z963_10575 [Clostridium botulinum C/D str. It1]